MKRLVFACLFLLVPTLSAGRAIGHGTSTEVCGTGTSHGASPGGVATPPIGPSQYVFEVGPGGFLAHSPAGWLQINLSDGAEFNPGGSSITGDNTGFKIAVNRVCVVVQGQTIVDIP